MKVLILGCLFLILVQCSDNTDNGGFHPETFNGSWTYGKDISVNYNTEYERTEYTVVDGDHILFEYTHTGAQRDDVFDDEWAEMITFVINKDATHFELTNEQIEGAKCFYREFGAWYAHNQYSIKDGIIKGRKIFGTKWEIYVSVQTTPLYMDQQPKTIEFSVLFDKVR
jgi:hypothetical protein